MYDFTFYFGIFSSLSLVIYTLALLFQFFYWHADKIFDAFVHKFSFPGKVLSPLLYLAENHLLRPTLILLLYEDFLDPCINLSLTARSLMPILSPLQSFKLG